MRKNIRFAILAFVFAMSIYTVHAQNEIKRSTTITAQCGSIIEAEFLANFEEQNFSVNLKAGDKLSVSVIPLGGPLSTVIMVTGPTNLGIAISSGEIQSSRFASIVPEREPKLTTDTLGANGTYAIRIANFDSVFRNHEDGTYSVLQGSMGVGVYTLYIGCTLRDGTVIEPGDTLPTDQPPADHPPVTTIFSGTGFPGLAAVDFSSVAKLPLSVGVGAVTQTGGEILGYTLDANANDILDLTFTRLSGNLNLGLVVLSADNQVVFQASLVTSTTLNTRFTLPSAGQYTIGVFRIDLLPPAAPEATAFQVQGTLNP